MIFEVWVVCCVLALAVTLVGLFYNVPGCFLLGGVFWIIAGFGAFDLEFKVVYVNTGYDYLKDFSYPYLGLFLGVLGLAELLLFGGGTLQVLEEYAGDMR